MKIDVSVANTPKNEPVVSVFLPNFNGNFWRGRSSPPLTCVGAYHCSHYVNDFGWEDGSMAKAFKIERYLEPSEVSTSKNVDEDERHNEIMDSLNNLHKKVEKRRFSSSDPAAEIEDSIEEHTELNNDLQGQVEEKQRELVRLKDEMRAIYLAIDDTKTQILTIKESGTEGHEIARAAEELSAIVKGTEEATNNILHAAENIETNAGNLVAAIQDESQQALACEIQENVVQVFENCNFQDLTGQRITKVVKTFCFIEARIMKMMEIWGGAEAFLNVSAEELEARQGDKGLLNGPSLDEDDDVATQADIDALFD